MTTAPDESGKFASTTSEALERLRALKAALEREGAHYRAATVAMAINIIAGDDQRKH
jgi:hypothetical protein